MFDILLIVSVSGVVSPPPIASVYTEILTSPVTLGILILLPLTA